MWPLLLFPLWVVLVTVAQAHPAAEELLVSGGVSATVAVAIYLATRSQARRQTTLDMFKEYGADFAAQRRAAERFMATHRQVDWALNDTYDVGAGDADLAGYSAVLRYWHRLAILCDEGALNRGLPQAVLSKEFGHGSAVLIEPMTPRKRMYVRLAVAGLSRRFSMANGDLTTRRARCGVPPRQRGGGIIRIVS